MRLVTYTAADGPRAGIVVGDAIADVERLSGGRVRTTRELLTAGPEAASTIAQAAHAADAITLIPMAGLELRAPIEDPDKIICIGLNYRDHAQELDLPLPEVPILFAKFRNSLVGPNASVVPPASTSAVDYEGELAVVIGRRAQDVLAADALDYVAGVMVMNDVSARDLQYATSQWTAGKAIDTFAPCGPALVTLDEIGDLRALRVQTRVNGRTVQDGCTADMVFDVDRLIEFLSGLMTLEPGDIIATGTPAGVGISRNPQVLLRPGDIVEVEIDGVGRLANPVADARAVDR
jgi:2-keto-4-pentenoate hydratase/2-oxohepta-3-ene-1,7-dioic acid hydratase in catechol pathway